MVSTSTQTPPTSTVTATTTNPAATVTVTTSQSDPAASTSQASLRSFSSTSDPSLYLLVAGGAVVLAVFFGVLAFRKGLADGYGKKISDRGKRT
jgi:hypothetical protein